MKKTLFAAVIAALVLVFGACASTGGSQQTTDVPAEEVQEEAAE